MSTPYDDSDQPHVPPTAPDASRLDLSEAELREMVERSSFLDPHSKRYWTDIIPHLSPEHRQLLAAALRNAAEGGQPPFQP